MFCLKVDTYKAVLKVVYNKHHREVCKNNRPKKQEIKGLTISSRVEAKQIERKSTIDSKLADKATKRLAKKEKLDAKLKALNEMLIAKAQKRAELKG